MKKIRRSLAFVTAITMLMGTFSPIAYAAGSQGEADGNNVEALDPLANSSSSTTIDLDDYSEPSGYASTPASMYGEAVINGSYQSHLIVEENELLVVKRYEDNKTRTTSAYAFDANTGDLSKYTGTNQLQTQSNIDSAGDYTSMNLNHAKAIAFDPTGGGRDDHVAYIGMQDTTFMVMIYNAKTNTRVRQIAFGSGNDYQWLTALGDSAMGAHIAGNYFDITAGDYDGDGHDSLMIYNPMKDKPSIVEVQYADGNFNITKNKTIFDTSDGGALTSYRVGDHGYKKAAGDLHNEFLIQPNASLTTGDYDGDMKDELAVAISAPQSSKDSQGYLIHNYGHNKEVNSSTDVNDYVTHVNILEDAGTYNFKLVNSKSIVESSSSGDNTTYVPLYQGSLATGNMDGDGLDELLVVGYAQANLDSSNDYKFVLNGSNEIVAKEQRGVQAYSDTVFASVSFDYRDSSYTMTPIQFQQYNKQTKDGLYVTHSKWREASPLLGVETAVMDGDSQPATIFVAGNLYTASSAMLGNKISYGSSFFDTHIGKVHGHTVDQNFVYDVVKGNFDNNPYGREQFFVTAMQVRDSKSSHVPKISIVTGFIGGTYENDKRDGNGKLISIGARNGYFESDFLYDHTHNTRPIDYKEDPVTFAVAAADIDDDGIMGKFNTKSYDYADPQVLAVLQAAPYFEEYQFPNLYTSTGATSYESSTTHSEGSSTGISDTIRAGAAFELTIGDPKIFELSMSVSMGYTGTSEYDHSFEESQTYSTSYTASSQDTVIVQRTPLVTYTYDVYHKENGTWEENAIMYSYPIAPTNYHLSIDDYNAMVDDYLNKIDDYNVGKTESQKITPKLRKLTADDIAVGTAGHPENYSESLTAYNDFKQLSNSQNALGKQPGHIENSWSQSTSTGHSTTTSKGLEVDASLMVGGGGAKVGGYFGYSGSESVGTSVTEINEANTSGSVENIDEPLMQDAMSSRVEATNVNVKDVIEDSNFNWLFGVKYISLDSGKSTVPVLGYITNNVTTPAKAPENVTAKLDSDGEIAVTDEGGLTLTWDSVEQEGASLLSYNFRPGASGYNVYIVEGQTATKLNDAPIKSTEFGIDREMIVGDTYKFYVTSVYDEYGGGEGLPSALYTIKMPEYGYNLSFSAEDENLATVTGVLDKESIEATGHYHRNSEVEITAVAREGYMITGYKLNGELTSITPEHEYKLGFNLKSNTDIVFVSSRLQGKVSYGSVGYGSVEGTINGSVFLSGQRVSGNVKLTATPDKGYFLQKWTVEYEGEEEKVISDGREVLEFIPYGDCVVTAHFEAVESDEYTITVVEPKNGDIIVEDALGAVITPDEQGRIVVYHGAVLKFIAVPKDGYKLDYWSKDVSSGSDTEVTLEIDKDIRVEAVFYADVINSVTFRADGNGEISASQYGEAMNSGDNVAANSSVTFSADAHDYSYFDGWYVNDVKIEHLDEILSLIVTDDIEVIGEFKEPVITSVEIFNKVNPLDEFSEMETDSSADFDVRISGVHNPPTEVTWSISGQQDTGTSIDSDGILTIAKTEKAEEIKIIATSTYDTASYATYKVVVKPRYYKVNLANGSKSGSPRRNDTFPAGTVVTITADSAPDGQEFDSWTSEGITLDTPLLEKATFTMPTNDVTITAEYKLGTPAVSEVLVVPGYMEIVSGEEGQFTADVLGKFLTDGVTWRLDPQPNDGTVLDDTGKLTVAADAPVDTQYTVVAAAVDNPNVTGTATAKVVEAPVPTALVSVTDGKGSGTYHEGDTVRIIANEPAEGYEFTGWDTTDLALDDTQKMSAQLDFEMPNINVDIAATYELKAYTITVNLVKDPVDLQGKATIKGLTAISEEAAEGISTYEISHGDDVTFTVDLSTDSKIASSYINGGSIHEEPVFTTVGDYDEFTLNAVDESLVWDISLVHNNHYNVGFDANYDAIGVVEAFTTNYEGKLSQDNFDSVNEGLIREYFEITEWNTESDGSGDAVDTDTVFTGADVIYAQWSQTSRFPQHIYFDRELIDNLVTGERDTNEARGAMTNVSYVSSNHNVAIVDSATGEITITGVGSATITANAQQTIDYEQAEASYIIKVASKPTTVEDLVAYFEGNYSELDKVVFDQTDLAQTDIDKKSSDLSGIDGYTNNDGIIGKVEEVADVFGHKLVKVTVYKEYMATLQTGTHDLYVTFKNKGTSSGTAVEVPAKTQQTITVSNEGSGTSGSYTQYVGDLFYLEAGSYLGHPFDSWQINSGTANLNDAGAKDTTFVVVDDDAHITALFDTSKIIEHSITASAGENGSINPSGVSNVADGESKAFTFTPDSGYMVDEVKVNGAVVNAANSYEFENVDGDKTISVTFKKISYAVSYHENGGTGNQDMGHAYQGEDYIMPANTFIPPTGMVFSHWAVGSADSAIVLNQGDGYKFETPVDVYAIWRDTTVTHIVSASAGENGSIAPAGEVSVIQGDDIKFTFTPNEGYEVDTVAVDEAEVASDGISYTIQNVMKPMNIHVTFREELPISDPKTEAGGDSNPQTGDSADIMLWFGVGLTALGLGAVLIRTRARRTYR